ncbi:unnamed protein product [Linum tenue]|uniref:Uncharacterized protein n=1 Tax=Linum tenue TaxID=586396 RepID=A0AAV0I5Q7_9ROSI|nr:unnamed protein product [Linum tenue]
MKGSVAICLLLFICFGIPVTSAMVVLKPFFMSFPDLPAKFAAGVNSSGICGALYAASPLDACSPFRGQLGFNGTGKISFALIVRGGCPFEEKIRNAQLAGFHAAIVFDDRDKRNLVYMMVNPDRVKIHAVFVSKATGEILMEQVGGEEAECCIYPSQNDTAWTVLAISFLSLVVIMAFLLIALVTPRHWLHWRRLNFHSRSVDAKTVETLPCFTFHSGHLRQTHGGETCVICLEDYKDGEVLKVLPCKHEFHSSCVNSWLTKWGTFCPVCKLDMRNDFTYSENLDINVVCFIATDEAGNPATEQVMNTRGDLSWTLYFKRQQAKAGSIAAGLKSNNLEAAAGFLRAEKGAKEGGGFATGFGTEVHPRPTSFPTNSGWYIRTLQVLVSNGFTGGKVHHLFFFLFTLNKITLFPFFCLLLEQKMSTVSLLQRSSYWLLLLLLSNWLYYSSGAEEVLTVDVHKAKSLIESGHLYVDVRTEEEFRAAHPDATKIWKLRGQAKPDEVDPNSCAADDCMVTKIHNIPYMFNTSQGPRFRFCLIHLLRCAYNNLLHNSVGGPGRVKNPDFLERVKKIFNQDDHLVVGCQSGVRSMSATADLLSAGFKHACNMGGGYLAWDKNGFPVKKHQLKEEL